MGTVKDYIAERFIEMGMSESQIDKVIECCKKDKNVDIDFQAQEYEVFLMSIIFKTVKSHALEWINKNIPQAWFKPCFE